MNKFSNHLFICTTDDEPVSKVPPQKVKKAKVAPPPAEESDEDSDDSGKANTITCASCNMLLK